MTRIDAVELAEVFRKAEAGEDPGLAEHLRNNPRLRELALWLQWRSGDLQNLAHALVAHYPERFQRNAVLELGLPPKGRYDLAQCLELWRKVRTTAAIGGRWDAADDYSRLEYTPREFLARLDTATLHDFKYRFVDSQTTTESIRRDPDLRRLFEAACEKWNLAYFHEECLSAARSNLAGHLARLPFNSFSSPWYCRGLVPLLMEHMDREAARIESGLAETEVVKRVRREVRLAESKRQFGLLLGDTRSGKTSVAKLMAEARPGLRRLVTPSTEDRMRGLLKSVADALGIAHSRNDTLDTLEEKITFVLEHVPLTLFIDEVHRLIPSRFNRDTPPRQLNWLRDQVIDRRIPCVMFSTQQTYRQSREKFLNKTQHVMEQWDGRVSVIELPVTQAEDAASVAGALYANWPEDVRQELVDMAIASQQFLGVLERLGKRSEFIAEEAGRSLPTFADVRQAEIELGLAAPVSQRPSAPAKPTHCGAAAAPRLKASRPAADQPQVAGIGSRISSANAPRGSLPTEAPARFTGALVEA